MWVSQKVCRIYCFKKITVIFESVQQNHFATLGQNCCTVTLRVCACTSMRNEQYSKKQNF